MSNRLIEETSPYLLQHAENPVDWYPWGEAALERARREDRPIFLSIGYSACHWCHVMERESFQDPEVAALLNRHFVSIKVDREERPDLDGIYMKAVQLLTGHGGWPMSVFLTPEREPFYGGTYYPPEPRFGMPSFRQVLERVAELWQERRQEVMRTAREIRTAVERISRPAGREGSLDEDLLRTASRRLGQRFDPVHGGFGGAPKFPSPNPLLFLLRCHRRFGDPGSLRMVETTLRKMARGGIYDQLGGGFHRYATDERWRVPHFEKMLYDNALLARVYAEAWQVTREPAFRRVCEETLDYLLRHMTDPAGGFYSTEDADSEGVEGKFYCWTPEEVHRVLGPELGRLACEYYGVQPGGNFEHGWSVLHRPKDDDVVAALLKVEGLEEKVAECRRRLLEARQSRVRPGRDGKVLAAWNGLALTSFATAYGAFGRGEYLEAARRNAEFVLGEMSQPDGRLFRSWKEGRARFTAYLEDYACFVEGLLALYQVDFELRWLREARRLTDLVLDRFWDPRERCFSFTDREHEKLITRPMELLDSAIPAGNSVMLGALIRLHRLCGVEGYREVAEEGLERLAGTAAEMPSAFGAYFEAVDLYLTPPLEVALVMSPDSRRPFLDVLYGRFLPDRLVALVPPGEGEEHGALIPFLEGKRPVEGRPTAYICPGTRCLPPVTSPEAVAEALP